MTDNHDTLLLCYYRSQKQQKCVSSFQKVKKPSKMRYYFATQYSDIVVIFNRFYSTISGFQLFLDSRKIENFLNPSLILEFTKSETVLGFDIFYFIFHQHSYFLKAIELLVNIILLKKIQMDNHSLWTIKDSTYQASQYQNVIRMTHNLFASRLIIEQEYSHRLKELVSRPSTQQFVFVEKEAYFIFNKIVRLFNQQSDSTNCYVESLESVIKSYTQALHQIQSFTEDKLAQIEVLNSNITRGVESIRQSIQNHNCSYKQLNQLQCNYLVECFTQSTMQINNKQIKVLAFSNKNHQPNCEAYRCKQQKIQNQIKERERAHVQMNKVLIGVENSFVDMTIRMIQQIQQMKQKLYLQMMDGLESARLGTDEESKEKRKKNYFQINSKKLDQIKVPEHRNRGYIKTVYDYCRNQAAFKQFLAFGIKHNQSQSSIISFHSSHSSHSSQLFNQIEADQYGGQIISFFKTFFIQHNPIENPHEWMETILDIFTRSKQYRKILCQCFESLRREEKQIIPSENIEGIKIILNNFLYQCMEEGDIWNSMKLISASVKLSVQFPNKKVRLHHYIYQHPIFDDEQWWFGCILLNCLIDIKISQNEMKKKQIQVVELINNSFNNVQTKIMESISSIKIQKKKRMKSYEFFLSIIKHLIPQIEIMKITAVRREITQAVIQKARKMFDTNICQEMDIVFQELAQGGGINRETLRRISADFQ